MRHVWRVWVDAAAIFPPPLVWSSGSDLPPLGADTYMEGSETDSEPGPIALQKWVEDPQANHGPLKWPKIGCGAQFIPWAKGKSQVVEVRTSEMT